MLAVILLVCHSGTAFTANAPADSKLLSLSCEGVCAQIHRLPTHEARPSARSLRRHDSQVLLANLRNLVVGRLPVLVVGHLL
eukprot:7582282-Pyramimonas_sp.AAC.1